jgi:hypothetical protein
MTEIEAQIANTESQAANIDRQAANTEPRAVSDIQAYIVGLVEKQLEEFDAAEAAIAANLNKDRERGAPRVLSVRLDVGERRALERRAAISGIKPSVLARNLIRVGLSRSADTALAEAVTHLESAVAELREAVA